MGRTGYVSQVSQQTYANLPNSASRLVHRDRDIPLHIALQSTHTPFQFPRQHASPSHGPLAQPVSQSLFFPTIPPLLNPTEQTTATIDVPANTVQNTARNPVIKASLFSAKESSVPDA